MFTEEMKRDFTCHPTAKRRPIPMFAPSVLEDVYNSYSSAKRSAYNYCKKLQEKYNGYQGRITSHNCMVFTYEFYFGHSETGEVMHAVITRDYNHLYFA